MLASRPVSTWSSWTGSTPCWIGNVWPLGAIGADGVPGLRSTKKLPSRKIRGRIANVASLCSGSPLLSISIVTSAARHAAGFFYAEWQPGTSETPVTLPTLTPAIRTSEPDCSPFALEKIAWIVYGLANGLANLV